MLRRSTNRYARLIGVSSLVVPLLIGSSFGQVRSPQSNNQTTPCLKQDRISHARHGRAIWLASSELMDRVIERRPVERPGIIGKNSLRGAVSIEVLINKRGRVICAHGLEGNPIGIAAAVRSLREWTFRPYIIGGKPKNVVGVLTVPYDFGS